ncbi:MAG: flagellar basal body P-ring protein FlgI [Planctomycetota bacterium]|nr:flagellar basal body P-ring protein FlgI [Planctomycetota bacterium]
MTIVTLTMIGCTQSALRLQSPENLHDEIAHLTFVREVALPYGLHPLQVDAIGMVGNLHGTGSDPPPSSERSVMITNMQKRDIPRPSEVLSSDTTSLVVARGYLRPGMHKGDRFDVEVFVPRDDETESLRDGILYEERMRERAVLGGRLREGEDLALVQGPVLVDLFADQQDESSQLRRGVILGGGVALKSRPLGLLLKPDQKDVRTSASIGTAINKRFHVTNRGIKSGVAKPKNDGYVELELHPRYKDNLDRYLRVVQSIALRESEAERNVRLRLLERQLLDPLTSASAAIRLEAIGRDAIDVLNKGLAANDSEVRFYAAEALAYLDVESAAEPLRIAAENESAWRAHALAALSAMDQPAAQQELVKLLSGDSAETRYGAFRALWAMDPNDPVVRGELLGGRFHLHVIRGNGTPIVHVARTSRPEIVLFGSRLKLRQPLILDAGRYIRINAQEDGPVTVSSFAPGQEDKQQKVSSNVEDVLRAIVEVGGTYPDVVQVLLQAKTSRSLECRLAIDAIPGRPRGYQPAAQPVLGHEPADLPAAESPQSDLYRTHSRLKPVDQAASQPAESPADDPDSPAESSWPVARSVGKIWNRMRN